jgi:hypothetical protein
MAEMQWHPAALAGWAVLAGLLALGGCAAPPPAPTAAVAHGRVVAARALVSDTLALQAVVTAVAGPSQAGEPQAVGVVEYVVRDDGGHILSIVQPASDKVHVGDAVLILRAGRARVEPAA